MSFLNVKLSERPQNEYTYKTQNGLENEPANHQNEAGPIFVWHKVIVVRDLVLTLVYKLETF